MNKMYVCFDHSSGEILRITNEVGNTDNYVEVDIDDIKTLQTGQEPTSLYIVEYNAKSKTFEFKAKNNFEIDSLDVNDLIYQIPANNSVDSDLTLVQDFDNTCWKIFIGKDLKNNLNDQGISLNMKLHFSITAKDDPNVPYKIFVVDFAESFKKNYAVLPFTENFEHNLDDVSVYTTRRFNTYQFKRIKNGKEI